MSSKLKGKLSEVLKQNKHLRSERQRVIRTLAAIVHHHNGSLTIPFATAALVEDSDQVEVTFNKNDGSYTIKFRGDVDAKPVGSGSEEVGVSGGEGDVVGPLPEGEFVEASGEVREGDQHHSKPFSIVRITDPE